MNILIIGAEGIVGRNLAATLENIRTGRDPAYPNISIGRICPVEEVSPVLPETAWEKADFVFLLAGMGRENEDQTGQVLQKLREKGNCCPVLLVSSGEKDLDGPCASGKCPSEEMVFAHGRQTGAAVYVYRVPGVFGKWCSPGDNSPVAALCRDLAGDLPISVSDPAAELELLYIDDLVEELLLALQGYPHRCQFDSNYCFVPGVHRVTLGEVVSLLESFEGYSSTLRMPCIPEGSFEKKLYTTYLSYLPPQKAPVLLHGNADARGSFTELMKTAGCGQFSVSVTRPGITRGQHYHHSKWELFMVVSGRGLVQMRKIGTDEVVSFEVSGENIRAVRIFPGYTHSLTNLSQTEDLVTLVWANECFDPEKPDTFYEVVT